MLDAIQTSQRSDLVSFLSQAAQTAGKLVELVKVCWAEEVETSSFPRGLQAARYCFVCLGSRPRSCRQISGSERYLITSSSLRSSQVIRVSFLSSSRARALLLHQCLIAIRQSPSKGCLRYGYDHMEKYACRDQTPRLHDKDYARAPWAFIQTQHA